MNPQYSSLFQLIMPLNTSLLLFNTSTTHSSLDGRLCVHGSVCHIFVANLNKLQVW